MNGLNLLACTLLAGAQVPQTEPPAAPVEDAPAPLPSEQDVVVTGRSRVGDPLVQTNAEAFAAAQKVDEAVIGPVADAYKDGLPKPLRRGLRNVITNLREPVVFANYLLQLKPGKAFETAGRFAINSTVGLAGLFDVAKRKPFNLPRRRNGFANTLGFYGVKPGAFLYLPLIGATTVRDLVGLGVDQFGSPVNFVIPVTGPEFGVPTAVVNALNNRVENDAEMARVRASADPYTTAKQAYLAARQAEIDTLKGRKAAAPDAPAALVAN